MGSRPYVGIDPGSTGAIALIHGPTVAVWDIPTLRKPIGGTIVDDDRLIELARLIALFDPAAAVLEMTWGVRGQGGSSQYKFGDTAAAIRIAFKTSEIRTVLVSSMKWKNGLRVHGEKSASIEKAIQLYPAHADLFRPKRGHWTLKQCEGRADAALIAHYGEKVGV